MFFELLIFQHLHSSLLIDSKLKLIFFFVSFLIKSFLFQLNFVFGEIFFPVHYFLGLVEGSLYILLLLFNVLFYLHFIPIFELFFQFSYLPVMPIKLPFHLQLLFLLNLLRFTDSGKYFIFYRTRFQRPFTPLLFEFVELSVFTVDFVLGFF